MHIAFYRCGRNSYTHAYARLHTGSSSKVWHCKLNPYTYVFHLDTTDMWKLFLALRLAMLYVVIVVVGGGASLNIAVSCVNTADRTCFRLFPISEKAVRLDGTACMVSKLFGANFFAFVQLVR